MKTSDSNTAMSDELIEAINEWHNKEYNRASERSADLEKILYPYFVQPTTDRDSIVEKCVEAVMNNLSGDNGEGAYGYSTIVSSVRTALRTVLNPE